MKTILPLVVLLTLVSIVSCKKNTIETGDLLHGSWRDVSISNPNIAAYYTFEEGGMYEFEVTQSFQTSTVEHGQKHVGSYELVGDTLYVTITEKYRRSSSSEEWSADLGAVLPEEEKATINSNTQYNLSLSWAYGNNQFVSIDMVRVN